jgi:hypothetical protein
MRPPALTVDRARGLCLLIAAALLGCDDPGDETADATVAPLFAADYEQSYVQIRDCRLSIEHELEYIRVFADASAATHYQACVTLESPTDPPCDQPFADGAVLLKAQYRDARCTELLRYSAVRREADASATGASWRWQEVSAEGTVRADGTLPQCINCHRGCDGSRDLRCVMDP